MNNIVNKRWVQKPTPEKQSIQKLSEELKINSFLSSLIAQRGIQSYSEAKAFFNPSIKNLHDPFLLKDMQKAVERIETAINRNERILIYGDYDVDGTTSVALVYNFISKFYQNIDTYVPDRFNEGYGISIEGIDYAYKNNISLVIALDCGIKEVDDITYAKNKGIEFIICDHHTPGEIIPEAFAILNPKNIGCEYPYKELSGCGIGFKLIHALSIHLKNNIDPFDNIDFVAVSIASDIVPITGENRILTYLGLQKINNNPSLPFQSLIQQLDLKKELCVTDLVFIFGPRLNASGRIAHAKNTVNFLISKDMMKASYFVNDINKNNTERKDLDQSIADDALEIINQDEALKNKKTTVLWNESWHKGVIGIVASRLTEYYYRPTIILTESDGLLTGSARSVSGFNLYNAIEACSEHLIQFGGHQFAAGLTLKKENFQAFADKFEEVVSMTIKDEMLIPTIEYDLEIPIEKISLKLSKTLDRFGPFGPGNMKPRFISNNLYLYYNTKIVGANHLKLAIECNGNYIDAIAFKMAHFEPYLKKGKPFHICYTIEQNNWNGNENVQLNIKDIKF